MTTDLETPTNEPETFIQRARQGRLFDPVTGQAISEARAAEILQDLHYQLTRTDGKAISEKQVASYLQDFTELPVTVTQQHQAKLEGKPLGEDNTEKVKELRLVMNQVEIELAAGNLQPSNVETYIQQKFPGFKFNLKIIQDAFIDRYRKLANYCAQSTSFEQLIQFFEYSTARLSPNYENEGFINALKTIVDYIRNGTDTNESVARLLVRGGFIPNKDNPILSAVKRIERSDPKILSRQKQGSKVPHQNVDIAQAEAPAEAAKYSLSLSIIDANGVFVETNPGTSAEMVKLIGPDGVNHVKIPLSELQTALAVMESITFGSRVGSAHDIDSMRFKYDSNTGVLSHMLIEGRDIAQYNTRYSLSITGDALIKVLDIVRPPNELHDGHPAPKVEADSNRLKRLASKIRDLLLGGRSEDEITQNETSREIPKPGISTLKAPDHFNQDRAGSGDVMYEVTDAAGKKVVAKGIRIVVNDGSGGSLPKVITEDDGRSAIIGGKAKAGLDAILQASDLSPAEAIRVAHRQIKDTNHSFSTVMVADIVIENGKGKLRFAGLGDPSVVAYRQDRPFEHRRSELSGAFKTNSNDPVEKARILAGPSHMQIQNLQHNGALLKKFYDEGRKTQTGALDSTMEANGIYLDFGNPEKNDVHPTNFEVDLEKLDADFILVMSDGAQPNSMLATDPRVDLSEEIAAEQAENPDGAESIRNQPKYAQEVQFIMSELTAGKIDVNKASDRITSAARNTLGDKDDITVAIIDVRQFRKTGS